MMQKKFSGYRWRIMGLLFFATTINYVDRQVIGILAPDLAKMFNWSEQDYSFIITAFQAAYAVGMLLTGTLLDKIGVRIGYAIAMVVWSVAGMGHALARGVISFATARFGLALGESANFPAAIKTTAEWFPKKERALATGLFNSGSNIGAIVAPIAVPFLAINYGWEWAFIATGALGLIWLVFWLPYYKNPENHPKVSKEELDHILSDQEEHVEKISWKEILRHKQTIGICLSRFVTDPVWWFFLYWLPKFLNSQHGVDLQNIGLPLIIIYTAASAGSIFGGWLSSFFIKTGRSINYARKATVLVVALMVVPIFFASITQSIWIAIILISLATAAHQGWGANIFTIVSDIFPKNAVGSVTGLAGFSGAIGGVLFAPAVGYILDMTGNYFLIFGFASIAYLLAWIFLLIFIPEIKPIKILTKSN